MDFLFLMDSHIINIIFVYNKLKKMKNSKGIIITFILILVASLTRILPHPPNVTPLAAMCLFGGSILGLNIKTIGVAFSSLFLSDFVINNTFMRSFYPEISGLVWWSDYMYWTYAGFLGLVLMGVLLKNNKSVSRLLIVSIIGSCFFFMITNFGTWIQGFIYPKTLSGLTACLSAGVPFFRNSLLSTVGFSFVIFYSYKFITAKIPSFKIA